MRKFYWFPYERKFIRHWVGHDLENENAEASARAALDRDNRTLELIDWRMHVYCGVERGKTKESIYRLLGWLSKSANMDESSGVPHDASIDSATDTD